VEQIAYIYYFRYVIYPPTWASVAPIGYPNPNTGKKTTQYWFATRSLVEFTKLFPIWYREVNGKFIKVVPFNINELLTPVGLAHWIMDDGYWDLNYKTIVICTDNFTEEEILFLIEVLYLKFKLIAKTNKRKRQSGITCWRIRFSRKNDNLEVLRTLIKPYIIPEM
jgi:hypothetical protein